MSSTKKHKKHRLKRREKYEEFSNNVNLAQFHWGYKWINDNTTSVLESFNDKVQENILAKSDASEVTNNTVSDFNDVIEDKRTECKNSKQKTHRLNHHKRHNERRIDQLENCAKFERDSPLYDSSSYVETTENITFMNNQDSKSPSIFTTQSSTKSNEANILHSTIRPINTDPDSSQDNTSFVDDDTSQPLPENVLYYAGMTTENSPSCRPVSKPIIPLKLESHSTISPHHIQIGRNASPHIQTNVNGTPPNIVTISPSTSSGTNSTKSSDTPRTSNSSDTGREPRSCVLKLKQQKSPLNKLLEHLLRVLEKRDPYQFFAWPVTDDIAPGYSRIISKPMDFSTIRQKIEDNEYSTLTEFTDDFRLMCDNAITYNHVDTVYHKAAKRLLQVGLKHLAPESLMRSLKPLSGYMRELTVKELGFELLQNVGEYSSQIIDSADEGASTGAEETTTQIEEDEKYRRLQSQQKSKIRVQFPHRNNNNEDVNSVEILSKESQADQQQSAITNTECLNFRKNLHKLGFWRLNKDGSTSLNVLIKDENEGPEKVIDLGTLVGKLEKGTGQVHSYREDKRNEAKMIKTLHYGPYSSFAPTFDSRFATLNKEESQLIMQTYDDSVNPENSLQYNVDADSSYATTLANGLLLNVFTNDDPEVNNLKDLVNFNYMEESIPNTASNINTERAQIEHEYEKYKNTRIDFNRLRTLHDLGIDVSFLDDIEKEMEHFELTRRLQEHLSNNYNLIDKLRIVQHERLSQPLPQHLALVPQPSLEETQLANQITQQLTDAAKKLPPSAISDPYSLRKAMGVSFVGLPPLKSQEACLSLPPLLQTPVTLPNLKANCITSNFINIKQQSVETNVPVSNVTSVPMDIDGENIPTVITTARIISKSNVVQSELHHKLLKTNVSAHIPQLANSNSNNNKTEL